MDFTTPSMKAFQLGDLSRRDTDRFPFKAMLATPEEVYTANFKDASEALSFQREYTHIKQVIANLNNRLSNDEYNRLSYQNDLKNSWIPLVQQLEMKWGKSFVPGDIRRAKNDVESNLGLALTCWPNETELINTE